VTNPSPSPQSGLQQDQHFAHSRTLPFARRPEEGTANALIAGVEPRAFSAIESNGTIFIEDEKDHRLPRETPRRSAAGSLAHSHDGLFSISPERPLSWGVSEKSTD
jgi:hypothetical protein